jgi:hypothetical protein
VNWIQKDKYHLESLGNRISATQSVAYSISKSIVYGKEIYELWELPYNNAKHIYRGESLSDVKAQAIQHYKEQLASASAKATGSIGAARKELAGDNQGALF